MKFRVTFYSLWTEKEFEQIHEAESREKLEEYLDNMDLDCVMVVNISEI